MNRLWFAVGKRVVSRGFKLGLAGSYVTLVEGYRAASAVAVVPAVLSLISAVYQWFITFNAGIEEFAGALLSYLIPLAFFTLFCGAVAGFSTGFVAYAMAGIITSRLANDVEVFKHIRWKTRELYVRLTLIGAGTCCTSFPFLSVLSGRNRSELLLSAIYGYLIGALGGFIICIFYCAISTARKCVRVDAKLRENASH